MLQTTRGAVMAGKTTKGKPRGASFTPGEQAKERARRAAQRRWGKSDGVEVQGEVAGSSTYIDPGAAHDPTQAAADQGGWRLDLVDQDENNYTPPTHPQSR